MLSIDVNVNVYGAGAVLMVSSASILATVVPVRLDSPVVLGIMFALDMSKDKGNALLLLLSLQSSTESFRCVGLFVVAVVESASSGEGSSIGGGSSVGCWQFDMIGVDLSCEEHCCVGAIGVARDCNAFSRGPRGTGVIIVIRLR
jgi:hypothetical protein